MSAARRAADRSPRGRWLLIAFLVLLGFSLALRYAPTLGEGLGRVWQRGRAAAARPRGRARTRRRGGGGRGAAAGHPAAPADLERDRGEPARPGAGRGAAPWGVDTLDKTNAPAWPFPETLLVVRSEREGCRAAVAALAERMGGVPVIVERREDLMLDATLVLGQDWQEYRWPEP